MQKRWPVDLPESSTTFLLQRLQITRLWLWPWPWPQKACGSVLSLGVQTQRSVSTHARNAGPVLSDPRLVSRWNRNRHHVRQMNESQRHRYKHILLQSLPQGSVRTIAAKYGMLNFAMDGMLRGPNRSPQAAARDQIQAEAIRLEIKDRCIKDLGISSSEFDFAGHMIRYRVMYDDPKACPRCRMPYNRCLCLRGDSCYVLPPRVFVLKHFYEHVEKRNINLLPVLTNVKTLYCGVKEDKKIIESALTPTFPGQICKVLVLVPYTSKSPKGSMFASCSLSDILQANEAYSWVSEYHQTSLPTTKLSIIIPDGSLHQVKSMIRHVFPEWGRANGDSDLYYESLEVQPSQRVTDSNNGHDCGPLRMRSRTNNHLINREPIYAPVRPLLRPHSSNLNVADLASNLHLCHLSRRSIEQPNWIDSTLHAVQTPSQVLSCVLEELGLGDELGRFLKEKLDVLLSPSHHSKLPPT